MTNYTVSIDQVFNPTKLYSDYLKGSLNNFLRYDFRDHASYASLVTEINKANYDRQTLYQIVKRGNETLGVPSKTLANIDLLRNPETLCVFTGQQTAIGAGPMYVIYKALTAAKLAKRFSQELNRPVVPCFWMATDDHDFEEVRNASFLNRDSEVITVSYNPQTSVADLSIADISFDGGVDELIKNIDGALIDTEFKSQLLNEFGKYYLSGKKLSEAFAQLFNHLLGDRGIILIDPNFPGMKQLFKPIFAGEVSGHENTYTLYNERNYQLLENGYHVQVHKTGEYLNLFYNLPQRSSIKISGDNYSINGGELNFTLDQLFTEIEKSSDKFSTNVLLRPIAQCLAFPVLAQVVGPSELAYYAQIEPLFKYFNVLFPIVYPRAGMTIVEPHIKKLLNKYELDISKFKNNYESVIGETIEKLFPSQAAADVLSISDYLNRDLDNLAGQLKDSDPEGYGYIINFRQHIDFEMKQLRKRLTKLNKKRHDELAGQISRTYGFLFPNGGIQERVISPLYYANKFGLDIFAKIYDALEVDKPEHSILEL